MPLITAAISPVVVISACGMLCLTFNNRLAAVVTRLRTFHRERLHAQEALDAACAAPNPDDRAIVHYREILGMLDTQIRSVLRRAHWIRRSLATLLFTIISLAACCLSLGLATEFPRLAPLATALFIFSLLLLILGMIFALIEIRQALNPLELESRFLRTLTEDASPPESGFH